MNGGLGNGGATGDGTRFFLGGTGDCIENEVVTLAQKTIIKLLYTRSKFTEDFSFEFLHLSIFLVELYIFLPKQAYFGKFGKIDDFFLMKEKGFGFITIVGGDVRAILDGSPHAVTSLNSSLGIGIWEFHWLFTHTKELKQP